MGKRDEMKEKTYTLFWLTGKTQIVKGYDSASAMNNAGIGQGALRALDFYDEGDRRKEWVWNEKVRNWEKVKGAV